MSATVEQTLGIFAAIVGLATVSVLVINGGKTAQIIGASGNAFVQSIRAATLR